MQRDTLSAPFGFTWELYHGDQVYLRARWYAPGQGRFVSEDPFAGWAEMPYSLHAYQYAYSNPVVWTDPSGKVAGWTLVSWLAEDIKTLATWHSDQSSHIQAHGMTDEVLASIMAATIAIESNWGEVLGKRWAGDVKGFFTGANPSTGIANITPGRAMTLFNDANCETPLYYHRAFRSPISIWPFLPEWEAATDFFEEQEWLALPTLDVEYAEDGYTPIPTHRRSADVIYGRLQNNDYSLDLLAANIVKGAEQSIAAGLIPSVFNIANYHWFGAWQSAEELHAGTEPWKHGIHGVRIVRNFDTAAEKLGLSVRLTSLPGQLQDYYSGVHPVDLRSAPPFRKTEQDWADVFAHTID